MKKLIIALGIIFTGFLFYFAAPITADTGTNNTTVNPCQPIYGGGETCVQVGNIVIDKKVAKVENIDTKGGKSSNEIFVDNLEINDFKFTPSSTIKFKIIIKNTGNSALSNVVVKDIFPQHVLFVSGDGKFDANTKTFTTTIDKLNPNETKELLLTGKVADSKQIPDNQGIVCVVNQASAATDGNIAEDTAQFCIQTQQITKGGLKVFPPTVTKETPPTGPEMLGLIALLPSSLVGYILRKKSQKNPKIGRRGVKIWQEI